MMDEDYERPGRSKLRRVVSLGILLGASVLVGARFAAKYGYLAGHTYWAKKSRPSSRQLLDEVPDDWYI